MSLFSGGLACQSAPCTVDAVSGEYAPGGALAGGGATGGGGMFGVYEVSKADGALVFAAAAELEADVDVELLDLVCFISSSALTSRSNCSLN
ncbi:MAG: hypothetical protein M3N91_18360 [Pseudomonadota bacterium]|nr:hypothetical protein [Pseudomonadota bacterium]